MKVVLDTNVLVAGLLSPFGPPAQVLQLLLSGKVRLCYDGRVLAEYRQVLARPAFGFEAKLTEAVVEYLEHAGELAAVTPWPLELPDPDDAAFLEVAGGLSHHGQPPALPLPQTPRGEGGHTGPVPRRPQREGPLTGRHPIYRD